MTASQRINSTESGDSATRSQAGRDPLLLSIDFEDWHQLVRRRVGAPDWEQPGPALGRQTEATLALLAELDVRATFFVLGMAARAHPELLDAVVAGGHEIGCHGDAHRPVFSQTPQEFAADLRAARATITELTGREPIGYRAPAFSITRETPWAYEVLAQEGFEYDASEHDTPRNPSRIVANAAGPHRLERGGRSLWELPVAVWRAGPARVPVGGASYWATMPTALVLRGLRESGPLAGLYLHPYELDPQPLRAQLPPPAPLKQRLEGGLRATQRNVARRRGETVLRAIAREHDLITYGEAHAQLNRRPAAGS
jgi:polysaccharide deacetylase family protein (PEP-CTERM system associated)